MKRRSVLKWLGVSVLGLTAGGGLFVAWKPDNFYYKGPKSDHFDGTEFFNYSGNRAKNFMDMLKWQTGGNKKKWPEHFASPFDGAKPVERVNENKIKVTMVGHATLLIQVAGKNFITDPVFVDRASPVQFAGPKRVNPPGIRFEDLPKIDYVLLSHNHYDHLDVATLGRLANEHGAKIITPLGNDTIIKKKHPKAECIVGDWGDEAKLDDNFKVHFETAYHWSARGVKDRRMALWAAFVVETPAGKIYHVGDTGFDEGKHFKQMAEKYGEIALAILPIGAYEPRWFMKDHHQNPDEAVQGHLLCKAKVSIAHHWGTFQLTNEGIEEPLEALKIARDKHGLTPEQFIALRPGEEVLV